MRKAGLQGFTLIEIMIVVLCMCLILIPVWQIFHQGTKTSLQGMLQLETTQEGRRVLKEIAGDLKESCWAWDDEKIGFYTIRQILAPSGAVFPNGTFSFLSFPQFGPVDDVIPKEAEADPANRKLWRRVSRVTYHLEPSPKLTREKYPPSFPIYALIREEDINPKLPSALNFTGGKRRKVLSERVLMFDITPYCLKDAGGNEQEFFWITLQLVDTINPNVKMPSLEEKDGKKRLGQRSKDLIIADFFDVVSPKYLAAYRQMAGPKRGMASDYNRITYYDPIEPSLQK